MKTIAVLLGFVSCLTLGLVAGAKSSPAPKTEITTAPSAATAPLVVASQEAASMKSCTSNSECPYGGCSGGHCGSCTSNSECKGWGGCSGGHCGSCTSNSECKGFGDCNGGHCTKGPY